MNIQTFSIVTGTASCNACCPYCVSKMTGVREVGYKEKKINWVNFKKACRLAQVNNVSTVLITGKGEPLLFPKQITGLLERIKEFDFPLLELQTNGILLEDNAYDSYLKKWFELGLGLISISIVHYQKDKNQNIYCPSKQYPDLNKVVNKLHRFGISVRFSVTMIKNYIDTPSEVEKMAVFCRRLGVEQLSLRPVARPNTTEDMKVSKWVEENELSEEKTEEVRKFLDKNAKRLITYGHGSILYDLDGQNVCLTNALTIKSKTENVRQLIFFPDGHLRFDWQYKGAVIL